MCKLGAYDNIRGGVDSRYAGHEARHCPRIGLESESRGRGSPTKSARSIGWGPGEGLRPAREQPRRTSLRAEGGLHHQRFPRRTSNYLPIGSNLRTEMGAMGAGYMISWAGFIAGAKRSRFSSA